MPSPQSSGTSSRSRYRAPASSVVDRTVARRRLPVARPGLSADTGPGGGSGVPFAVQLLDDVAEHRPDDADGIADSATGPRCTQDKHARPRLWGDDAGDLP